MAIQREIWQADIVANLFKGNEFLRHAYNADQYVLEGKVVHIPQAGAKPKVVKNRTKFPAEATRREDTDVTYSLDEYTSDPVHIPHADTVELSYDKRSSVLSETQAELNEKTADGLLRNWYPTKAENRLLTTGASVSATTDGATGTRKALTLADISKVAARMNKLNVPKAGRYALLPTYMYQQLLDSMTEAQLAAFSRAVDEKEGVIGKLYGFTFYERSSVLVTDATGALKAEDAAAAATDCEAALFWQTNSVERALGSVQFFEDIASATYYGDVYSALVRMGGRIRREDEAGVIAVIQATGEASQNDAGTSQAKVAAAKSAPKAEEAAGTSEAAEKAGK